MKTTRMFLTVADYKDVIKDHVLAQVIETDDATRQTAELKAQAQMESYLSARYDTGAVFGATGTDRNAAIVMYLVDMAVYHLHARISPDMVPQLRKERYDLAIRWLEQVSKQMINPTLPEPEEGEKEEVRYGSNLKRTHHF